MGLVAKLFLCFILLHHLLSCSGYVQGNENNVEERERMMNRQLISGGGRGGGSRSGSSNHGSGKGTATRKAPFTPYGAVYAAGAANNHNNNNNNNHRNAAAPTLTCNRNNIGLLFTLLVFSFYFLVVVAP